ncbi:uncharacterized protein LOC130798478 [Amaranthus tricolor]|uniref:uncharacterized protein LOC130798478 n=1 Tax=Amaranthus tricolor TaxID=29722 RepID=UPI002585D41D|nr:uncharacterized protein LOC130798478 [Amaranthus tricolor]XP_057517464.1 uncharacterized protein LOC130798478 [Amaranthus tricolor]XP_057517465.1 uncharacterized protein LOC130798478 [Amaranthus tricolor]XP_057517466.1 uncharacterized protein LOC130798478 [Amaranthus tricolor]XP_057517467.1 uncharacterized protein LOC130798478 [Amaranthus tricolor]XP_057517468.1 uncharacterized protein LOC130798478 [Amaranthus tricolor]XP_057517469.1 uncharacterized protein LOC130798478 [Amaranthus tricolo
MIELFLSKPIWGDDNSDSAEQTMPVYDKLEKTIWRIITSEGRSEARLWLCESISSLSSVTSHERQDLFMKLLRSKPVKLDIAAQVLQMFFERRPQQAGLILSKKSHRLEKFFDEHPARIMQWFSTFSIAGDSAHGKGAKSLAQFAFVNRDICWEELEWKGKHGQSPAVVATKPHYFLDLDVQRTVENFLENIPEFWSSEEFAESLKDGEILSIDNKFFIDFFLKLMYEDSFKEVWEVLGQYFMDETFSYLCQRLLIILDERDLHFVVQMIQDFLTKRKKSLKFDNTSYWLKILICECGDQVSMDQLYLLNALLNKGRLLLQMVNNGEEIEEKVKISDLTLGICTSTKVAKSLALISKDQLKSKTLDTMKWYGLLSWSLLYRLSEECHTSESWEELFVSNNIGFRKSDVYGLVENDRILDESELDFGDRAIARAKRKNKKRSRKKRRRDQDYDECSDENLFDLDDSDKFSLNSSSRTWLLSTDGYSTPWSLADLPEHLSKHCWREWMKHTFSDAM